MALTNLSYLQNITGGDPETIKELIVMFIDQVPEFIANLRGHLNEKRYLELGKEAHKAKSSVMIMGMNDLGYDLKALQLATIAGTGVDKYPQHIDRFENECQKAIAELQEAMLRL